MKQNRKSSAIVLMICVAMAFFIGGNVKRQLESEGAVAVLTTALTDMALPVVAASYQVSEITPEVKEDPAPAVDQDEAVSNGMSESDPEPEGEKTAEGGLTEEIPVADSVKVPQILIYHTHATESYQPVTEGNFHSVEKTGTVREVGDAMAQRLSELGYEVIHDETIHDNPSYNQSYSRSLETAKGYLEQYPGIRLVVDLHRDAAGYAGSVGKTVSVAGKNAASYGYVIGQGNPNVAALTGTVNDLNRVAGTLYPEFTGKIIEKAYKFNQYISDHHVLVEVGNNENTIEQAKLTGYYLAEIFGAYLAEVD